VNVRFRILGPLEVCWDGQAIAIDAPRQRAVLAALLLEAGRVLPPDRLIALVWGPDAPQTAPKTLQTLIYRLRQLFQPYWRSEPLLVTRPSGYLLHLPPDSLDLAELERLHDRGREALREGDVPRAVRLLTEAHRLSRGPALADVAADGSLSAEIRRLRDLQLQVLEDRLEADLRTGRHAQLVPELTALVAQHPLREAFIGQLMLALYRCGRQDEALTVFREAYRQFADELAIARDRLTTERVAVVVSGKAGVGKTTFAVHLAHTLGERFPDGRLFVSLGPATTPQEAHTRVLMLLGTARSDIPHNPALRSELFRDTLARRRVLFILDNAAEEAQVRPLLPWGTGSTALVTSRRPLAGIESAHHLSLPELSSPESVGLLARLAGAARVAAEPGAAERIVRLCDQLPLAVRIAGGKLAAKPRWTLGELADRLTDEHRRLDELQLGDLAVRASLMLTYRALDVRSKYVFRVLGQLDGADFPAWVAATLVESTVAEVSDVLEMLVDWQILDVVERDPAGRLRYRLHDLLAVFSRELRHDETSATERHTAMGQALGAWLTVFDAMEARLVREARSYHRPTTSYPLGWMPAQRSVLSSTSEQTASAILVTGWSVTATLVSMSFELWSQWDNWRMTRAVARYSARRAGDRLIPGSGDLIPGRERPWDEAIAALEACVTTFQRLDELGWHAVAKISLGNMYRAGGRLDLARSTLHDCINRCHALGQRDWEAAAQFSLGSLSAAEGDLRTAVQAFRSCQDIFGDRADLLWQAYTRRALGYAYQQHGRHADAVAELTQALPVFRDHEDGMWEAHTTLTLGLAYLGLRRTEHAIDHLEACVHSFRQYGDPRSESIALRSLAHAEADRGRAALAETHLRESLTAFCRLENTIGIPLLLSDLSALCERTGRVEEARAYREAPMITLVIRGSRSVQQAHRILQQLDLTSILDA